MRNWRTLTAVLASLALAACGGRETDDPTPDAGTQTYTVGGTVSGLTGTGLKLRNNGGDELTVSGSTFTFATKIATGGAYAVTVSTQPTGQTCTVANGTGTVAAANVTNVAVTCAAIPVNTYTVGGNVSGLAASTSVGLKLNNGAELLVNANGAFTFPTAVAAGQPYAVTVSTQPTGLVCTVASGSGTIAAANVTNVAVTCAPPQPVVTPDAIVLRVGNGTAPASGTSAAVSLLKFGPTAGATPTTLIDLPSDTYSIQYSSGSEGGLTRSEDGRFVAFGVYRAPAGTASVQGTTANATRTAVGVNAAGTATFVDFPGTFVGNGIRSATTSDGLSYWASGNAPTTGTGALTGGVWYASTTAPTPVQVTNTPNNSRWVSIYGGQLYVSSSSGSNVGVNTVGTGKPTASAGNAVLLPNTAPNGSPHGYAFVDTDGNGTLDVLYVTSDNAAPAADTLNLVKFTNNGGTWTQVTGFAPALAGDAAGTRSVAAARAADGTVIVYVVTGAFTAGPNNNKLVFFNDNGTSTTPAVTVIATAEANYNFRGVALAPNP